MREVLEKMKVTGEEKETNKITYTGSWNDWDLKYSVRCILGPSGMPTTCERLHFKGKKGNWVLWATNSGHNEQARLKISDNVTLLQANMEPSNLDETRAFNDAVKKRIWGIV